MENPEYEYWVSLYNGEWCVGGFVTQSIDEANARSDQWAQISEKHTTKINRREKLQAEHNEVIPAAEYLLQDKGRGVTP